MLCRSYIRDGNETTESTNNLINKREIYRAKNKISIMQFRKQRGIAVVAEGVNLTNF